MSGSNPTGDEPVGVDTPSAPTGGDRPVPVVIWETLMLTLIVSTVVAYGLYSTASFVQRMIDEHTGTYPDDDLTLWERIFDFAAALGDVALENIGWALGAFLPTVLAFFVLVVGEQWVFKNQARVSRLRARLANAAQLISACTLTAVALIAVHWVHTPSDLGAALFVIPAVLVLVGLGVALGTFAVPERSVAINTEQQTIEWAEERLEKLPEENPPSESGGTQSDAAEITAPFSLSTPAAIVATSLASGLLAALIAVERNEWSALGQAMAVYSVSAMIFAIAGAYQRFAWFTARDRVGRFFSTIVALLPAVFGVSFMLFLLEDGLLRMGIALLSSLLVAAASSFVVPTALTSGIYRWSVHRAVVHTATTYFEGKLSRSRSRIAELHAPETEEVRNCERSRR